MIADGRQEHLCLMLEPPEGFAVYYPVPVPNVIRAYGAGLHWALPAPRVYREGGIWRKVLFFLFLYEFPVVLAAYSSHIKLPPQALFCLFLCKSQKSSFDTALFCFLIKKRPDNSGQMPFFGIRVLFRGLYLLMLSLCRHAILLYGQYHHRPQYQRYSY